MPSPFLALPPHLHIPITHPPSASHPSFTTRCARRLAYISQNRLSILHGGTIASMVDLGGSLAVASRGLFATGVSTDLNVTYLNSGGKVGERIRAEVVCDKFGKTLAYTRYVERKRDAKEKRRRMGKRRIGAR